ncbi:MAG: hypothetical protein ACOYEV_07200 [Candidatus Nanopelagicales bacterium]
MEKRLLANLPDKDRLLVRSAEPKALAKLTEDEVSELHDRIRRGRNKNVGIYRRQASGGVKKHGGRGKSRPKNTKAALRAEAFEEALANVSARLHELAEESAYELRTERLAAARAGKGKKPASEHGVIGSAAPVAGGPEAPAGDRQLRSAAREHKRAGTTAKGARRQAKKDAR